MLSPYSERFVLTGLLIAPLLAASAAAQTGSIDQYSLRGNNDAAVFLGGTVPGPIQQQIRAGVSGQLEGFDVYLGGSVDLNIRLGTVPNTSPPVWQTTISASGSESTFLDTTAAGIQLAAGDTFTIEFVLTNGSGLLGSLHTPPCYPEPLFNPGGGFPDFRLMFRTWMLLPAASSAYCTSGPNSTGSSAHIWTSGSASVAADDLAIHAGPMPNTQAIFYYGMQTVQIPFGNGFRCIGTSLGRMTTQVPQCGSIARDIDWSALNPAVTQPGATFLIQGWFRDPFSGPFTFDLTDAIAITTQP